MTSADTAAQDQAVALSFPLELTAKKLDAGKIVINADLAPGTIALLSKAEGVSISIIDAETYENAAAELAKVKAVSKKIDEERKELTRPYDDAKAEVMAYVRPFTEALARVEGELKRGLIAYETEQENKRKLAEAEAAERARKAQDALQNRAEKAEASGHVEKAEALREQATTMVYAAPASVAAPPKVKGLSSKKTYTAEVTDLMELVKAVAEGRAPIKALQADQKFLNQMATAMKDDYSIPGTKLVIGTSLASRAAR